MIDLSRVERLFADGDVDGGGRALWDVLARASKDAADDGGGGLYATLVAGVAHPDLIYASHLALAAGALIEGGVDPRPLARALHEPFARAVDAAVPFVAALRRMPAVSSDDDIGDDGGDGDVAENDDGPGLDIGDRLISRASFEEVARADPRGAVALASMDTWYMPVVASWSRDLDTLVEAQRDTRLSSGLPAIARACIGGHWASMLLKVTVGARFVVLLPELQSGFAMTLTGVSDMGQLTLLLSDVLHDSLAKIGASTRADPDVVANARGEGEQEQGGTYASTFHVYPWQAIDPATRFPRPHLFQWRAPGGTGDHSLPADFLPADVVPVRDDVRVVSLVGPNAPDALQITRVIPATRLFGGLRARIDDVRALDKSEADDWTSAALQAKKS